MLLCIMVMAFMILVADYYFSNMSFPILDSSPDLAAHAYVHDYRQDDDIDDIIFPVNTAKDKDIAVCYDIFGREEGHVTVSDRKKLAEFLSIVSDADYRYIFIDLRFENAIVTPHDSVLYSLISSMPRLVYSRHRSLEEEEADICGGQDKGAYADYRTIAGGGFSRYEFLQDGHESVALRMFHDMKGRNIEPAGLGFYRDTDGSLCYNMQFIPFPVTVTQKYASDGEILYPLMGSQVLGQHSAEELQRMVKDKIIVIGDFENDEHDTYVGSVPGPLLAVYAWNLLDHDGHKLNYWLQLFLFVFYSVVIFIILLPDERKHIKNPMLSLLVSFLGWGFSLWVLKSMLYWIFGLSFIVVIPAVAFSIIDFIHNQFQKS